MHRNLGIYGQLRAVRNLSKQLYTYLLGAFFIAANVTGYADVPQTNVAVSKATVASVQVKPQFATLLMKGPNLNREYGIGVAAPFCGIAKDTLVMAGGYNYPANTIGQNTTKRFYKDIYGAVLQPSKKKLTWKKIAELPEALALGSTVATKDALYFIGGSDAKGDKATCVELKFENNAWKCDTISWLPILISNHGSVCIGDYIYVVGGLQNGKASADMYRMNLKGDRKKWEKLPAVPEDCRIQPIVTAQKDASGKEQLYIWSGFNGWGKEAGLICGGYKYNPETRKWTGLGAPLKNEKRVYLGGGGAVAIDDDKIIAVGGFNYGVLLNSLRSNPADFNSHPVEWYKHNKEVYCFNTKTNKWSALGEGISLGTVHAGLVVSDNAVYNISGEIKPGTNTNVVTRLNF